MNSCFKFYKNTLAMVPIGQGGFINLNGGHRSMSPSIKWNDYNELSF